MYVKLKDNIKISKSVNCVVFTPDTWKLLSKLQFEKIQPFIDLFDISETLPEEIKLKQKEEKEKKEKEDNIDLSSLKKSELIVYIITNNISDKTDKELQKLSKIALLEIALKEK